MAKYTPKLSTYEDILGVSPTSKKKKKKKAAEASSSSPYTPKLSTYESILSGAQSGGMPSAYDYSTSYNEWLNSDEGGKAAFKPSPYVRPDSDPRVDPFRLQRAADPLRPGFMFPPYSNAKLQDETKNALAEIDPKLRYYDQRGGYERKMKSSEELARRIADAEMAVANMEGDGSEQARKAYADAAQKALDVMAGSRAAKAGQKLLGALSSTGAATMELGAQGRENIPVIGKFNNMVTPAIDKFSDIVEAGDRLIGQSKPGDEEEQDRMMRRAAVLQPLNTGMTTIALGVPQLDSKRNWEAMIGSGAFGEIKDQMQKAVNMEYDDEFADSRRIAREFGVSPEHLEKRKVATLAGDALNDYANFVGFGKSSAAKTASREVANSLATGAAPRVLDDIGRMAAKEGADDIARIGMEGYDFAKDMSTLAAEGYDPQLVQRVAEYAGAPKTAAEVSRLVDPNTVRGAVEANPRVMTNLFDQELRNAMKVLGLNPDDAAELASKSFGRGTPLLPKEEEAIALATTRSAKGYGLFGPDIPFVADDIRFGRRPAAAIGNVFRRPIPFIDTSVRDILRPQMAKMGELSELGRIMSRNRRTAATRTAVEAAEARSRELQREAQRAGDNRGLGIISDQLPDPLRPRMTPEPAEDILRTADELTLDPDDGLGLDPRLADDLGLNEPTTLNADSGRVRRVIPDMSNEQVERLNRIGVLSDEYEVTSRRPRRSDFPTGIGGHADYQEALHVFDTDGPEEAADLINQQRRRLAEFILGSSDSNNTPAPLKFGGGRELYALVKRSDVPNIRNNGLDTSTELLSIDDVERLLPNKADDEVLVRYIPRADNEARGILGEMERYSPKQIHIYDDTDGAWKPSQYSGRMSQMADAPDDTSITDFVHRKDLWSTPDDELLANLSPGEGIFLDRVTGGSLSRFSSSPPGDLSVLSDRRLAETYAGPTGSVKNAMEEYANAIEAVQNGPGSTEWAYYVENFANGSEGVARARLVGPYTNETDEFLGDGVYLTRSGPDVELSAPAVAGKLEISFDHTNKEAYISWMGVGGGGTAEKAHSKAGKSVYSLMQKAARVIRDEAPDYTITNSPGNSLVERMYRNLGFTDTLNTRGRGELQFNPPGSQAFAGAPLGASAGIGEDEDGNIEIDWKKAILGAAGAGVGLSMLNRGKKAIAAGELEKVSMLANVAKGMTKGDPDTLPGIIKSLDEAIAAGDFGKKTPRLLDDAGTVTPAGRRFMKVMEHQDNLAEEQAKFARENNIPLNLVDNYQPAPLPSTGRRRKVNQRTLNDINFGTKAVEDLPKNDWFEQLRFGGKRRFGLPSKKVMREQANRRYTGDMLSSLTEDAANYNRVVNDPGRLEVGVQKKKSYPTPMSRARDGKLVEMNPYEAYASSEMMLKQLKAQNDQLLDLMGSRGTPISEEQAQKYLSGGIYGDRVFTDMNGNRFLVKDHDQAKTIRELIQTNDVRTQATPTGLLSGANRTLSSWVNPLMTTANPAFMFTNQLGNIILGARNGVGREMPEALRLVTEAWKAGGDTSKIADDATREMVELAEREGVLNALSLDPSTMWDYNVQSPLYNAPILGTIPRTVQRLNAAGEGTFRTAAFLEEMARNGGNASAARMYVDDVFFNYDKNALSAMEQGALGVMPFYNFTRRNLPATAEYYGKHPSRLDIWGKMQRNLGQEEDRDVSFRQENTPEYLHDQFTVRTDTPAPEPMMLPGIEGFPYLDQEWTPKMMDYSGVYNNAIANVRAPEVDALRIANIIEELSRGETKEASDFVGDLLGPAPQTLGQWVADADVPDTYGGGTARENILGAIASQTPRTSTFFNAAAKAGKSEVKGGDPDANKRAFLNWLGPVPFYNYNPGAERRRGANIRESELNELVRQLSNQGIEVPEKSKARTTADEFLKSDKERYEEESKAPKNEAKEREYYMVAQYERWKRGKTNYKPRVDKRAQPPTEEGWAWMKDNYPDAYKYYREYYKKRKLNPNRKVKTPIEEALGL